MGQRDVDWTGLDWQLDMSSTGAASPDPLTGPDSHIPSQLCIMAYDAL